MQQARSSTVVQVGLVREGVQEGWRLMTVMHTTGVGKGRAIYRVGQTPIYVVYNGIFGRETIEYTVIYGVYIQFWPTLLIYNLA